MIGNTSTETVDTFDVGAPPGTQAAYWSGVFAMTVCVFALIASEFLPVSLLSPIAADLRITEGMAGQGIAISGAFAVVTSLSISFLTAGINRKTLLLWLTGLMAVSGLVVALAPNFLTYMIGRALLGIVIGGFWSMSAAIAMRLVPRDEVPRAMAIFNGGNALATVIAAPLGSWLGGAVGWRGAFLGLLPIALIALIWQWISLPSMAPEPRRAGLGNVFRLFKRPVVTLGMLAVGTFFMGQFALFTYLRPFLETVTQVDVNSLTMVLLIIGVSGFIGTAIIGTVLKANFYRTLVAIPLVMAAIAVALIAFGGTLALVVALLGIWGLVATAAPVGWWSWIARTMPHDAEAGGGLMVAVIQLSIALGSTIGGLLFDMSGYASAFGVSAAVLVAAALLAMVAGRAEGRTR